MVGTAVRVGVVAGLVASVLAAGAARAEAQEAEAQEAGAQEAGAQEAVASGLCDTAAAAQFQDVGADDYGAEHILCMRTLGLSAGRADGTYGPDRGLTRAQMASFIVRLWRDVLNRTCPDVEMPFTDVDPAGAHAADIACLHGLGITTGATAATYEPRAKLTASQVSRLLARTYRRAVDTCGTAEPGLDEAVALLRGLRVIPSGSEGTGGAEVTRAQMAVYLIGLWHNIAGRGRPPPPPRRSPAPAPAPPAVPFSMDGFANGPWLQQADPQLAASISELEWVRDGVDGIESAAVQDLLHTAAEDPRAASSVASLEWVRDGVDGREASAIGHLASIVARDAGAARQIAAMPFLASVEPPDVPALDSLAQLAAWTSGDLERVMERLSRRGGISDDLAPVVATLAGTARTNPGAIDVLLDPGAVSSERRILTLPLSGEVIADVLRTGPGASRSIDLLEHSVRCTEEFMGVPLPTDYVVLLFADAVTAGAAGTNFGTHMAVLPEYDTDSDGDGDGGRAGFAGHLIAHEVAHYYWRGSASWIDEGAADFMGSVSERARTGRPLGVTNVPCAHAGNIADLEGGHAGAAPQYGCNYALGERLFVDLYRVLGDGRFQRGFRRLHLLSQAGYEPGAGDGASPAIGHVREAFRSNDGAADTVIARWYDGTEPHDLSSLDPGPVDPELPRINGRIDSARIVLAINGTQRFRFSVRDIDDRVYLRLRYSYSVSSAREVSIRVVELYEDGVVFRVRSHTLAAEPGYVGGKWWVPVGADTARAWARGRYWVYVYADERKVAELLYVVTR